MIVVDLIGALFVLLGALLCFGAAVSLERFPDVLSKLHAITKPQVLGMLSIALGVALSVRTFWAACILILVVVFQLLTSPVSATMVARASYRSGLIPSRNLNQDDLAVDLTERKKRADDSPSQSQ